MGTTANDREMNASSLPSIFLIRHGETEWSQSGRHTGCTDVALTAKGEEEARALKGRLEDHVFTQVLVSPRVRARRTCELAGLGRGAVIEPLIQEWDYGEFEGLTTAEIESRRQDWNLFRDGSPGGEGPREIGGRADALLARLRTAQGKVAVFSHGHFLRVLAARWIQCPVEIGQKLSLNTASISVLGFEHGDEDKPVILSWNETQRPSVVTTRRHRSHKYVQQT